MKVFALALLVVLTGAARAQGPIYTVNSVGDAPDGVIDGVCDTDPNDQVLTCTLRAAIMEVNSGPDPGEEVTINVPAGTYTLTTAIGAPDDDRNGDLNLSRKVRIAGAGSGNAGGPATIIDANHLDRVFFVHPGSVITLQDLRIQGGRPPTGTGRVGEGNGGAIYTSGASVTLVRCLVRDNQSQHGYGGAIHAVGGSVALVESTLRVNASGNFDGGAISASSADVSLLRSTLNTNLSGLDGGGIYLSGGTLTATNSTIADNDAPYEGGGIFANGATVRLYSVTLGVNRAGSIVPGGDPVGGGIAYANGSAISLSNCVLENFHGSAVVSDDLGCHAMDTSTVASNGYNNIAATGGCPVSGSFMTTVSYLAWGSLAFHGGSTVTVDLPPISSAIDAGNPAGCLDRFGTPLTTDQRGVKRPIGARCDLGAFEVEPIGDVNGDGLVNVADVLYLINHLFAGGPLPVGRANVNGDSSISVADVLYLVNYLFAGGPAPG